MLCERLDEIKHRNKVRLAEWLKRRQSDPIPIDAVCNVQTKRLYEYRRRPLNTMYILGLYYQIKADPGMDVIPCVLVFGAKVAPGYK